MYLSAERLALANQAVHRDVRADQHCLAGHPALGHRRPRPDQGPQTGNPAPPPCFLAARNLSSAMPFQRDARAGDCADPRRAARRCDRQHRQARCRWLTTTSSRASYYRRAASKSIPAPTADPATCSTRFIDARADVENAGYRAPSCLITNTAGLKELSQLTTARYPTILSMLLAAANINSLYRVDDARHH